MADDLILNKAGVIERRIDSTHLPMPVLPATKTKN